MHSLFHMKTTLVYYLFKWSTIDEFTPNDERVPTLLLSQFTPFIFTTFAQRKSTIIQKHEKFKSSHIEKKKIDDFFYREKLERKNYC